MYEAKILCDSVGPTGARLTTMCVTFPRIVLAEFNTHRKFCLAGDAELEFDLPAGTHSRYDRRVYRMRLDEFVDKWLYGARRVGANPKVDYDVSWVVADAQYSTTEAAARMGMATPSNLNLGCRNGTIRACRGPNGRTWMVTGEELLRWRRSVPEHTRFDIRSRLAGMRIRQLNERTGDIQWSHVVDACESGTKDVFEVMAGDYSVAGSKDHQVLTSAGWKTIGELRTGDLLIVRRFGKRDEEHLDPTRLQKIDGVWRNKWQYDERQRMRAESTVCRRCCTADGTDIHHIEPVYVNPARAFDRTNITLLCEACHHQVHATQGWQGGTYLYGAAVPVDSVTYRGRERTFDLSIGGEFPNFLANGVVVHNSRNSASSRAIPVEKQIQRVLDDPFIPIHWGKNQKGMQAEQELDKQEQEEAANEWRLARSRAVETARALLSIGVHKQITNRLLEPWMWQTVIVSATEWQNFFALRCHKDAQPEIRHAAVMMRDALNESRPVQRVWHLPFVTEEDKLTLSISDMQLVAVGRCARVSYLTHDGKRDPQADITLAKRLQASGHMSPFEHVAEVMLQPEQCGNFYGWRQYRKTLPNEAVYVAAPQ